ncbi:Abi family protein [Rathayibacter sp. AY1E9]|uniref:Abi family protein n=1 Tax=Rathayibacter sp. AY1E9 TaxID=2080556 RepID=UPI0015E207BC|nr:Abi family protein [Rathayibacter sp. AY1E9]
MGSPYAKPHLSYESQLAQLEQRGLIISDRTLASEALRSIGYYRLSAYLHTFRKIKSERDKDFDERLDEFEPGVDFTDAYSLWKFDRDLRLVLLDGLETFETALRASLAYWAGAQDPFIHLRPDLLSETFTETPPDVDGVPQASSYSEWLDKYDERLEGAKSEVFIRWFFHRYEGKLPIWTAVEILELGQLVRLLRALPISVRRNVARDFGVDTPKMFISWASALNGLRNYCAHHARLWNRGLVNSPARPKRGQIEHLDHLQQLDQVAARKIYSPLATLVWMLSRRSLWRDYRSRVVSVLATFPETPYTSLSVAGFPTDWRDEDLWVQQP